MALQGRGRNRGLRLAQLVCVVLFAFALCGPGAALAAPPANDDFGDAAVLTGEKDEATGFTWEATKQSGESSHGGDPGGASIWYSWTAPRSGYVYLDTCDSDFATLLGVYRGPTVDALTTISGNRTGNGCERARLVFRANAGAAYRIAIDGFTEGGDAPVARGTVELDLAMQAIAQPAIPANDDFENAQEIANPYGSAVVFGTTEGAARQAGEPDHGGGGDGSSVWFSWTARRSGLTTVSPCTADFRPAIGVYAGEGLNTLHSVVAEAGLPVTGGECALGGGGGLKFKALADRTYWIAIEGLNGGWGFFRFAVEDAYPLLSVLPQTRIRKRIKLSQRTATLEFESTYVEESEFLCKLDRRPYAACSSPVSYRNLATGRHSFAVKAVVRGFEDPTPAIRHFRVKKPRRPTANGKGTGGRGGGA